MTSVAFLLLFVAVSLDGPARGFEPSEPISVDLRDARVVDVITTLGAIADLPVSIGPGVDGTMTVQMEAIPFDQALELISRVQNISLRISNGRLVATSLELPGPYPAPTLSGPGGNAPRIRLSEYAKASARRPRLFARVRTPETDRCFNLDFGDEGGGQIVIRLAGGENVFLTALDYDPTWRIRYVVVETGSRRAAKILPVGAEGSDFLWEGPSGGQTVLTLRQGDGSNCSPVRGTPAHGSTRRVRIEFELRNSVDATRSITPRILTIPRGGVWKELQSTALDPASGENRGFVASVYLSRDGAAVAVLLKTRAVWSDPLDGDQYYYTQPSILEPKDFVPLTPQGIVAAEIPAGPTTPYPAELRVASVD